jgi:hypothetical protein
MSLIHGASLIRSNLFLHLDAANTKSYPGSGTTWLDLSGNGNNGTIVNSPTYNGASFTFTNASSQSVNIPYKSEWRLIGSNSISYWSNGDSDPNRTAVGYQKGGWRGYQLTSNFAAYSGVDGSNDFSTGFTKTSGEWCLFTWVVDRSANQYRLYKNDVLSTSATITQPDLSGSFSGGELTIGSSQNSPSRFYTGSISAVMFYTKVLSAAEIQQNFEAFRGRYGI